MAEPVRIIGKRTEVDEHIDKIMDILYDYGPHTAAQIGEILNLSPRTIQRIMPLMKAEGIVVTMNRDGLFYWILKEDALL